MESKNNGKHEGILTERQWAQKGYLPNESAEGEELWTNGMHQVTAIYYSPQEVHLASEEELNAYWAPVREQRKLTRRRAEERRKERIKARELELERRADRILENLFKEERKVRGLYADLGRARELLRKYAAAQPTLEPPTIYKTIVLDTETTGLDSSEDEVLELSMIADDGTVLYQGYFHPLWTTSWPRAEEVNHISPEMVQDAPVIYDELPVINGILKHATTIVGYNASFDMSFLWACGVVFPEGLIIRDVMVEFAAIYGEIHPYYGDYKWQTLSTCADYYGYQWAEEEAHDSLADARATLHCLHCIDQAASALL